jgi:hypothetical protein
VDHHAEPRASAFHSVDADFQIDRSVEKRLSKGHRAWAYLATELSRHAHPGCDHFINAVRYIRRNPIKAKLPDDAYTLWQSERAAAIS